jgi:carbon-monoxide dehydrogenase small subunit
MKKSIKLRVNGSTVDAEVEPRLQLAEFLREHLSLTGTHLGCEHGVCGACTVQIDASPARSCIAYAAACDGADVRTIEGFDDDPVMAALREAFSAHHALQCGYCTPGMLVTARDIVMRLPDADEARIRKELSGNLCRCTGYVGIVRAIQSVLASRPSFDPAPAQPAVSLPMGSAPNAREVPAPRGANAPTPVALSADAAPAAKPQTTLHQSLSVAHPREKVWAFFGRLGEVTACLPGASVIGTPTEDHVDTRMRIKVGPIVAEFEGAADAVRDASTHSGLIHGSARDTRSSSATRGEIRYVLFEEEGGAATRVEVDVGFTLTGSLAQFSRSSIVQDIAQRMTGAFAQNLQARLDQLDAGAADGRVQQVRAAELDAGSLFLSVLWNRIRAFFRSGPRR